MVSMFGHECVPSGQESPPGFGALKRVANLWPAAFGTHRSFRFAVSAGQHRQPPEGETRFRRRHASQRGKQTVAERRLRLAQPIAAGFLQYRLRCRRHRKVEKIPAF
jgi:hypothetical protein